VLSQSKQLLLATFAASLIAAREASAQGGPPMITDDPGTPGNGKWEDNIAITLSRTSNQAVIGAPLLDLNYGWGDHIQLTLQTPLTILQQSGRGPVAGPGGTEAAVKWRFLDQDNGGFDISTFPRVIFTVAHSSVRRGLAEDGTRFQIPVEISKKIGENEIGGELGPHFPSVGRSEWLYGVIAGRELSKTTEIIAELHGTSRMNFDQDTLTLNFGFRQELNKHAVLICSLGHDVRSPDDEPLALVGYFGVQLLY
jgi:hypothetical protein